MRRVTCVLRRLAKPRCAVLPSCADPAVLPLVLVALIGFAAHKEHSTLVSSSAVLHTLLRIVAEYDPPFKRLAGAQRARPSA